MSRLMINPSGVEIVVSNAAKRQMISQGDFFKFKKREFKTIGKGNPKNILLDLRQNGIGDAIHALPAIAQKIKDGFLIEVLTEEFIAPLFAKIGCRNVRWGFEFDKSYCDMMFGAVYNLKTWCMEADADNGESGKFLESRFQQFADLIETALPESFDFEEYIL